MFTKHVNAHFQFALIETNILTIATKYTVSSFATDPETDVVANNSAESSCEDEEHTKLKRIYQHKLTLPLSSIALTSHPLTVKPIGIVIYNGSEEASYPTSLIERFKSEL